MREVDIVYLYEHVARELDVACALAAILEREHHLSVEVVQWPVGFPETAGRIRPRMVLLPFCYSDASYRVLLAFWRNSIFVNLSWEQLFYFGNRKAKTPRGDFSLNHVIHHSWSSAYAEFLQGAGVPEKHLFVNGQPAYTLYDEPYRHYFTSRADLAKRYGLDISARWVFFPENYNWAFYSNSTIERFIENGQSPADIKIMRDYCERSLEEMLHWCAEAARLDKVEIILRPRPSTSLDDFLDVAKRVLHDLPSRFHIIQRESVREWILASDMVVSSHSTSLIEAAVAGKYSSIVAPFPIPSQLHVDWHDSLPHLVNMEDFLQVIRDNLVKRDGSLGHWARKVMMGSGDAIRGLAEYFSRVLNGTLKAPATSPRENITPWLKVIPPAGLWSLYRRLRLYIRFFSTGGIEPEYVKDYVPRKEIRARIQKWKELLAAAGQ